MQSTMKYRCPNLRCGVTLAIPPQMQGRKVRCGSCGQSFHVPLLTLKLPRRYNRKSDDPAQAA